MQIWSYKIYKYQLMHMEIRSGPFENLGPLKIIEGNKASNMQKQKKNIYQSNAHLQDALGRQQAIR